MDTRACTHREGSRAPAKKRKPAKEAKDFSYVVFARSQLHSIRAQPTRLLTRLPGGGGGRKKEERKFFTQREGKKKESIRQDALSTFFSTDASFLTNTSSAMFSAFELCSVVGAS